MRAARLLCAHAALAALSLCARTRQPLGAANLGGGDDTTTMEVAEPETRAQIAAGGYTFNLGRDDPSGKKGGNRGRPKKTTVTKSKAPGGAKARKTARPTKATTDMEVADPAPPPGSAPQKHTDATADALTTAAENLDALFAGTGDQKPRVPTAAGDATPGTRTREPEETIESIAPTQISAATLALSGAPQAPEGKRRRFLESAYDCVGGVCRMVASGATRIYNLVAVVATALSLANMVVSVWIGMFGLTEMVILSKVVLWILAALLPRFKKEFALMHTVVDVVSLFNVAYSAFGLMRSGAAQSALQTLLGRTQALIEAAKRDPQGVFRDFVRIAMDGAKGAADRVQQLATGVLPPAQTRLEPGLFPEKPLALGNATHGQSGFGQSGFGQSGFGQGGYAGFESAGFSAPGNVSYASPAPYGYGQSPSGFGTSGFGQKAGFGTSGFGTSGFGTPKAAGLGAMGTAELSSPFGPAGYSSSPAGVTQQQLLIAPPPPKVPAGILGSMKPRAFRPRPDNSRALVALGGVTSHVPETPSAAFHARAVAEDLGKLASASGTGTPIFNATEHAVDPASAKSLLGLAVPILEGLGATDAETSTIYSTYIAPAGNTLDRFLHPGAGSAVGYVSTAINVFGFATSAVILGMQIAGFA